MNLKRTLPFLLIFCISYASSSWQTDIETGLVIPGYNDIKIPGDIGTKFSLKKDLTIDNEIFYRIRLTKEITNGNFISLLFAPLTLSAKGTVQSPIGFNNDIFPAGADLEAKYRFDSYRLSYWKEFPKSKKLSLKIGFTAKIRNASIMINDGNMKSEKKNTGFVPLLNFGLNYSFSKKIFFIIDGDALAGGPGRAEDVLTAFGFKTDEKNSFRIGYRIVEGGADTDEVYTFAMLNYLLVGFNLAF